MVILAEGLNSYERDIIKQELECVDRRAGNHVSPDKKRWQVIEISAVYFLYGPENLPSKNSKD